MKKPKFVVPLRRNQNGHAIVDLHYGYDPDKNNETWISKAEKAYPGGRNSLAWRREMEMDWSAGIGELVFDFFTKYEKDIIVDPAEPALTSELFGGFDWGDNNPCSFHVYEYMQNGTVKVIWEWYQKNIPSAVAAGQAVRMCPYYDKLQWIAADPMIWTDNQYSQTGKTSLYRILTEDISEEYRIDKLMQAHNRNDSLMIQKMLIRLQEKPPTFKISKLCPNMIKEFKNLRYKESKADVNSTGKIVNKDNHTWDDAKYFLLSHPSSKNLEPTKKLGTYGYLNDITEEAETIARRTGQSVQDVFSDLYESVPQGMEPTEEI